MVRACRHATRRSRPPGKGVSRGSLCRRSSCARRTGRGRLASRDGRDHRPVVPECDRSASGSGHTGTAELGHSTLLSDIDGRRLLVDPLFCERASPFSFAGPARFYPSPLPLADLPRIDAVLISHDHSDHLDAETVRALAGRDTTWIAPLGVGAHLAGWGVPEAPITELDWVAGRARGRSGGDRDPSRRFSGARSSSLISTARSGPGYALFGAADRAAGSDHST